MGGTRRPQEAPRATLEGPRSRQERRKSLPESSGKPLQRPLAPQRPPRGFQGAILGKCWKDFEAIFEPFFGSGGSFARVSGDMFLTCSLPLFIVFRAPSAPLFAFSLLRSVAGQCHKSRQRQHRETRQTGRHRRRPDSIRQRRGNATSHSPAQHRMTAESRAAQHGTDDLTRTRFPFQRRDMVPFRVGGVVFSLLGVSWRLLARFWVPLGASAARFEAPGLPRRPPASILGAIFAVF